MPHLLPSTGCDESGAKRPWQDKKGPSIKTHFVWGLFSLVQTIPPISANTFPCSVPCLYPSLGATPTCLHTHFIKLWLSNALCSVEVGCPLLFNWPTASPLLLNKWEGQWLLITWVDDVCQCRPKDRYRLKPPRTCSLDNHVVAFCVIFKAV